jgi:hypothetical protein
MSELDLICCSMQRRLTDVLLSAMQECSCFADSSEAAAAGGVQEALRLDLAAAPIFSLALDSAPASGGRQQVNHSACEHGRDISSS